jgi:hypothetical protein
MPERADLGFVHQIDVRPDAQDAEIFNLLVTLEAGERISLLAQREALRGLWSYLTQILYPRAVDLTKRMETVVRRKDGIPPDVTYMIAAYADSADPSLIVIGGFTPGTYWNLKLGWEACENLWAGLEDHLNQV